MIQVMPCWSTLRRANNLIRDIEHQWLIVAHNDSECLTIIISNNHQWSTNWLVENGMIRIIDIMATATCLPWRRQLVAPSLLQSRTAMRLPWPPKMNAEVGPGPLRSGIQALVNRVWLHGYGFQWINITNQPTVRLVWSLDVHLPRDPQPHFVS